MIVCKQVGKYHGNSTLNSLLMCVKAWHATQQYVLMGGKEKVFPSLPADTLHETLSYVVTTASDAEEEEV